MELRRAWIVYMHRNKINGKVYIGITCRSDNPNKRWCNGKHYESNKYFTAAIKKYGWDNFEHIILFENINSEEEAIRLEALTIEKYNALDRRYGYNTLPGGKGYYAGYKMSKEHKQHMMEGLRRFKESPEYQDYIQKQKENGRKCWEEKSQEDKRLALLKTKETKDKNRLILLNKPICKVLISKGNYYGIGTPYISSIYPSIICLKEKQDIKKILRIAKRVRRKIFKEEVDIFKNKEDRWCFVEDAVKIFPGFNPIVKYNFQLKEISKIYIGINDINVDRRDKIRQFLDTKEIVNKKYIWLSFKDYLSYSMST